jgi:hypothetical protein
MWLCTHPHVVQGPCLFHRNQLRTVARKQGPHSLQDIESFVCHVICEYCDGEGHVPDDSCSGSPKEATLLVDGAGLRQPLRLAHPSDSGLHSTLPGPPELLNLPLLRSLLTQVI